MGIGGVLLGMVEQDVFALNAFLFYDFDSGSQQMFFCVPSCGTDVHVQ